MTQPPYPGPNDPSSGGLPQYPSQPYGQQPYGQQPYGQQPGYGYQAVPVVPTPVAPAPVKGAFWLYILGAVISVVSVVLLFSEAGREALRAAIRNTPEAAGLTAAELETAESLAFTVGIAVAVIFVGLYLLFAFKMLAGRNWARVTLTVLSGLSVVSAFTGEASGTTTWASWISAGTSALAIILMFLPESSLYFRQYKAWRAQQLLRA